MRASDVRVGDIMGMRDYTSSSYRARVVAIRPEGGVQLVYGDGSNAEWNAEELDYVMGPIGQREWYFQHGVPDHMKLPQGA